MLFEAMPAQDNAADHEGNVRPADGLAKIAATVAYSLDRIDKVIAMLVDISRQLQEQPGLTARAQ